MGFFEHLAAFDDSEREQERTASAVANRRVQAQFGHFVRSAVDANDRRARLDLIEDELRQVVADVTSEYGGDPSRIEASLRTKFAMDPYGPMGEATVPPAPVPAEGAVAAPGPGADLHGTGAGLYPCAQGHPDCAATPGGACSQSVHQPDQPGLGGFGTPMSDRGPFYAHEAAEEDGPVTPLFGDRAPETQHHPDPEQSFESIDQELKNAPSAIGHGHTGSDSTGLSDKPEPKMDKKRWVPNALGDGNLEVIDTDGGRFKTEQQDVTDKAKYKTQSEEGDSFKADSPVVKHEDLPSEKDNAGFQSGGEEHGDHTDTWSGKKDQANPVTNTALSAHNATSLPPTPGVPGADPGAMPGAMPGMMPGGMPGAGAGGGAYGNCPNCGGVGCPLCQGQQQQAPAGVPNAAPGAVPPTIASVDVDKNPLREILESEFNGFMPQQTVQQAIASYKRAKQDQ